MFFYVNQQMAKLFFFSRASFTLPKTEQVPEVDLLFPFTGNHPQKQDVPGAHGLDRCEFWGNVAGMQSAFFSIYLEQISTPSYLLFVN